MALHPEVHDAVDAVVDEFVVVASVDTELTLCVDIAATKIHLINSIKKIY